MPIRSTLAAVDCPEVPLVQNLLPVFESYSDKLALVDALTDTRYTFSQLVDRIKRLASALRKLGLQKGDVVAICSPNSPEWCFMFFAILANGATLTTLNPAYTAYEIRHNLKDSKPVFAFTIEPLRKLILEASKIEEKVNLKKVIVLGKSGGCGCGCINFEDLLKDDGSSFPHDIDINPREHVAVIPYSSGTTGLPKGVMLTHYNLTSQLAMLGDPTFKDPTEKLRPLARIAYLPFYHVYGMIFSMLAGLADGGAIVILQRFAPEPFLKAIEKYKVGMLPLVPPVIVALNNSGIIGNYDLSSVRRVLCGGAPLSKDNEEEFTKSLKVQLRQGYGMTEVSSTATMHSFNDKHSKAGSSGIMLPNTELKIIDTKTGTELGAGDAGEICYRGPNQMKGYLNRPGATAATIDKDGWLHTGDIGYYDEHCHLYVVERLKELIKYKGFQVAPAELEGLLLNHPKIADVGVIGIPDKEAGELPRAYVVKAAGEQLTEKEVKDFVAEHLAFYKQLRGGVQFVTAVPKSPSGKILRKQLREKYKKSKI